MVDVVDDDECRLEDANVILDGVDEAVVVLTEDAEHVEAHEGEVTVGEMEVALHLAVDLCAVVWAVDGVYPQDFSGIGRRCALVGGAVGFPGIVGDLGCDGQRG